MNKYGLVATSLSALLLGGCGFHHARVKSVNLSEAGTYVVSSPGALTIARQSGNTWRACTMRTGGMAMGKHGHGHGRRHGGPGDAGGRRGGPGGALDVLLFRLCEARANNDITAAQYASGVQTILKTMSKMAERRPPPGPGMGGHWNPRGQGATWFHEWMKHEHGDHGDHEHGDHDHHGPEAHPGPQGGPPHAPAHKGNERRKHH